MQASIYMGNVLKWLKFVKFLAPCILIEKLDKRPHTSFQIHKISNGHKMFPIKCRLLFPVYFILSEEKWYIRGSAVDLKQKTSTCFSQIQLFTKEWINSEPGFLWRFRQKQLFQTDGYTLRLWNLCPEPIISNFPKLHK